MDSALQLYLTFYCFLKKVYVFITALPSSPRLPGKYPLNLLDSVQKLGQDSRLNSPDFYTFCIKSSLNDGMGIIKDSQYRIAVEDVSGP